MKLIYHPLSPYSRKVYILALELGLADQITLDKVVVAPVFYPGWSDDNASVSLAGNPLAKIPTLVVDDFKDDGGAVAIFDSKVICAFLRGRAGIVDVHHGSRAYWREQAVHAACDGMLDAEILVTYEERLRAERGLKWQPWVDGQREKVRRGMDFLERMVGEGVVKGKGAEEQVTLAEIAVAVTLGMFDLPERGVSWREGREGLDAFYKTWEGRESYRRAVSARDADWKRAKL